MISGVNSVIGDQKKHFLTMGVNLANRRRGTPVLVAAVPVVPALFESRRIRWAVTSLPGDGLPAVWMIQPMPVRQR